ncbi:MAG: hypothetical protein ACI9EF_002107, partial [Pseudohongiellaceae bacterium]
MPVVSAPFVRAQWTILACWAARFNRAGSNRFKPKQTALGGLSVLPATYPETLECQGFHSTPTNSKPRNDRLSQRAYNGAALLPPRTAQATLFLLPQTPHISFKKSQEVTEVMSVTHQSPCGDSPLLAKHGNSTLHLPTLLFLLPLLLTAGCADEVAPHHDIGEGTVTAKGIFPPKATTSQRFGFRIAGAPTAQSQASHGPDYEFDIPPEWAQLPPSQYRLLNFQVAGDADTTCYLTVLSGNGGGLTANVNRWRQQMQL